LHLVSELFSSYFSLKFNLLSAVILRSEPELAGR
jgi:hypothetical protein